jgi:hypothetical protein
MTLLKDNDVGQSGRPPKCGFSQDRVKKNYATERKLGKLWIETSRKKKNCTDLERLTKKPQRQA